MLGQPRFGVEREQRFPPLPAALAQRVLLVTDGTVTHLLELFAEERIDIGGLAAADAARVAGVAESVGQPTTDLATSLNDTLSHRDVVLRGARSGQPYLVAHTVIVVARLDPRILAELVTTADPIGRVMARYRLETFREVHARGSLVAPTLAPLLRLAEGEKVVWRRYVVSAHARPVMMITEVFAESLFATVE